MVPDLFFYPLVLVALVWLCLMLQRAWPSDRVTTPPTLPSPTPPRRKRRCEPKPFAGLTRKPHCDACEPADNPRPHAPSTPPPRIVMTRGRRRAVDTAHHFCPNPDCAYRGWVGWGNLRANGHPNGGPWRQLLGVVCRRSFLETLGTLFHGKRASVELVVRVIACLADGVGLRGTARVLPVDATARPQVPGPSRAGCRCPSSCMPRSSRPCAGGAWCGCGTAWSLAPWRPSMPWWLPWVARAIPRSLSASSSRCASMWPRGGDGSAR